MMKILAVVAMAVLLTGCAALSGAQEDRGRIAVTYGVLKLVEQSDQIDGDRVLSAVERVRAGVSGRSLATADTLVEVVMAQLDFEGLSPADQFLITSVIGQVQFGLVDDEASGVLPEGYQAELGVWLDWIEEAAYMAGAGR